MAQFVFSLRNLWYLRILEAGILGLVARGHGVDVAVADDEKSAPDDDALATTRSRLAEMVAASDGRLTFTRLKPSSRWTALNLTVSRLIDFFYFRSGRFSGKPALVARASGPPPLRGLLRARPFRSPRVARSAAPLLARLERRLPSDPAALAHFRRLNPDLVVVSPLIDPAFPQFDQLRAARRLGLSTALVVNSWDNLSSKAWVRDLPDVVAVWNDVQKSEAETFHGIPAERIAITGASSFDRVYGFRPAVDRAAFLASLGLPPERPLIAYVASATLNPTRSSELAFVRRWVAAIRGAGDERLRTASILVRPHPKRRKHWESAQATLGTDALVWPPVAENPVGSAAVGDYLTTLFHADAVVGLNTSAFLEAAALGRPVLTVLDPEFAHSQTGTFHFDYLAGGDRPILRVAPDLGRHLGDLAVALAEPRQTAAEREATARFLRPRGADFSATDALVATLEAAATAPREAAPAPFGEAVGRMVFWPLAALAGATYRCGKAKRRPVSP